MADIRSLGYLVVTSLSLAIAGCSQSTTSTASHTTDAMDQQERMAEARADQNDCAKQLEMYKAMADEVSARLGGILADSQSCANSLAASQQRIADLEARLTESETDLRAAERKLDVAKAQLASSQRATRAARDRIAALEKQLAGETPTSASAGSPTDSSTYRPLPNWGNDGGNP